MSTTLSYGYKLPQDGDSGANDFWDDLEFDIQRLNDHDHDGVDSANLSSTAILAVSHAISTTTHGSDTTQGWVLQSDGSYKRTIAMASFFSSLEFDEVEISIRKFTSTSSGEDLYDIIYPTIEKTAVSTYDLTLNDITTAFLAVYSS